MQSHNRPQLLQDWRPSRQWAFLAILSVGLGFGLERAGIPAAALIGPMIVAVVAGTNGATVRVKKPVFGLAQAVVGCLVAASVSVDILSTFASSWLLVTGVVLGTLAASSFAGWAISHFKVFPGTTAVWGTAPGGSTAMVLMAEAFGADARLVAFMQYLRVIMVTMTAALVARMWTDGAAVDQSGSILFPAMDWPAFGAMLAVAVSGSLLGRICRIPSPYFLGAVVLGGVVHIGLDIPLQVPDWLQVLSYMLIGWAIGLNFTSGILRHAFRALPQIVGSIVALIAFCGGLAWIMAHELGVDPLTAYLATSPGGLDSVAIIAAASDGVDISFVMALQTCRLLFVLAFGPFLAKLVSRWISQ
jgi:hypothetical protein